MRIAYCIHSLNLTGGMERVLSVKASRLAEDYGHEVFILSASMKGRKPAFPLSPKVKLVDVGVSDRFGPGVFLSYGRALRKVLKQISPDITVSLCGNDVYFVPSSRDGSVKLAEFHFSHDKFFLKYGDTPYARLRTRMLENALRKFRSLVVLTEADAKAWREVLPSVDQIYNPLTFPLGERSPLTAKRFMAAGRLERQKDYPSMVRAWEKVAARHPDWSLDIFGEGHQKDAVRRLISSRGLEGKVRLMERSSDIRSEMLDSSGLLLSSRFEGFPMVLLEGAAMGLPLVSFDCHHGPSEIVRTGETGILVPPGDTDALADAVIRIIEDEELRRRLGAGAYARAEAFLPERVMDQWNSLFVHYSSKA
ncbi:MAG: glycosyltransferase family 4 protein [Bacteroidales bacterium]|nr:glycosyltransferase family 4 protein [Bacteroidales bacterium]